MHFVVHFHCLTYAHALSLSTVPSQHFMRHASAKSHLHEPFPLKASPYVLCFFTAASSMQVTICLCVCALLIQVSGVLSPTLPLAPRTPGSRMHELVSLKPSPTVTVRLVWSCLMCSFSISSVFPFPVSSSMRVTVCWCALSSCRCTQRPLDAFHVCHSSDAFLRWEHFLRWEPRQRRQRERRRQHVVGVKSSEEAIMSE